MKVWGVLRSVSNVPSHDGRKDGMSSGTLDTWEGPVQPLLTFASLTRSLGMKGNESET